MPQAGIDTSVLFAAAYQRDDAHEAALPILHGIDAGRLPEAVVIDFVLAETLNGLGSLAGHDQAVDFLDRLEANARFHIDSLSREAFSRAKAVFRRFDPVSFVDACLVAYMQTEGLGYLYAFNDDFDSADDVYRLDTPMNPYEPESE